MDSETCSSSKTCRDLLNLDDYTPPSCTNDSQKVSEVFNNLKLYVNDMKTHIENMKAKLILDPDSPEKEFIIGYN